MMATRSQFHPPRRRSLCLVEYLSEYILSVPMVHEYESTPVSLEESGINRSGTSE
jgi:hypothetical protein